METAPRMTTAKRFWIALALLCAACGRSKAPAPRLELPDLKRPAEEWLREEPVRLLRDYVRIDTNPKKGEREGAEFLRHFFECEGIEVEMVCPAPERCNVLARLPGRRRENALLLLNHIDVVEAFPQFWKEAQPFEGTIKLGFLYGRGAYDMKSLGLAQALAMRSLKRRGIVPETDILFLGEADEEVGQRWGARWLLEHRPEWFAGVKQVLNEGGTTEVIVRDVRFWGLETLQAGYALAEFEAPSNAPLEGLAARWPKLVSTPVTPHPHVVEGFEMLANHLSSPLTDPLRHLDRVAEEPGRARHPAGPLRLLHGGADQLVADVPAPRPPRILPADRRHLGAAGPGPGAVPAPDPRGREEAGVDGRDFRPERSQRREPVSRRRSRSCCAASPRPGFRGSRSGPVPTFGGYTTSILLRERGIPAYGFSAIPMNITDASRRHGNDERIFLRDYLTGVELFTDVLEEFALHPPAAN